MSQPSLFGAASGESAAANIDGGSRGNPGPAGYGVRIEREDVQRREPMALTELKKALALATNNVAEYSGLLAALEWAASNGIQVLHIRSDSELLVKQMKGLYRVKNAGLQPLYEQAVRLTRRIGRVTFEHVRREFNKEADRLANEAMDEAAATST